MTFLNGLFLFGLFAGLVPVLIHLLARRRAERREFPSLEFLREILYRRIQRARLRQFLLLMLRILAMCALAAALALCRTKPNSLINRLPTNLPASGTNSAARR